MTSRSPLVNYKLLQIFVFEKDNQLHKYQLRPENVYWYDISKTIIIEIGNQDWYIIYFHVLIFEIDVSILVK
jgi:hypothetical protein